MSDPIYVEVTTPTPIEVTVTEAVVVLPGGGGAAVDSVDGRTGVVTLGDLYAAIIHSHVVSDVTGLQAALDAKAPLASPAFTGTPTGITKTHVGLANVDNTSDVNKPISTATQSALNLKADAGAVVAALALKAPLESPAFTGTPTGITKAHVGLGNVDNTSDASKPVSTATQNALDGKANTVHTHAAADVASGTLATARLGSGTADATTFLRGDQTWATPAGGGGGALGGMIPRASGEYIQPIAGTTGAGGTAYVATDSEMSPIVVSAALTIDAMGVMVTTSEAVGFKILLYSSDANGYPETLVATAAFAPLGSGNQIATFPPVALSPGLYWVACKSDAGTTLRIRGTSAADSILGISTVATGSFQAARPAGLLAACGTFASPNATLTTYAYSNSGSALWPTVYLRRA